MYDSEEEIFLYVLSTIKFNMVHKSLVVESPPLIFFCPLLSLFTTLGSIGHLQEYFPAVSGQIAQDSSQLFKHQAHDCVMASDQGGYTLLRERSKGA